MTIRSVYLALLIVCLSIGGGILLFGAASDVISRTTRDVIGFSDVRQKTLPAVHWSMQPGRFFFLILFWVTLGLMVLSPVPWLVQKMSNRK